MGVLMLCPTTTPSFPTPPYFWPVCFLVVRKCLPNGCALHLGLQAHFSPSDFVVCYLFPFQVYDTAVHVRYLGISFRKISVADIVAVKQCAYDWRLYGGWGIRRASGCCGSSEEVSTPQWAHSIMGVPECVRVQTEKVAVDISSSKAAELAACIEARCHLGAGLTSATDAERTQT